MEPCEGSARLVAKFDCCETVAGTEGIDLDRACAAWADGEGEGVRRREGGGASSRSIILSFAGDPGARGKRGKVDGQFEADEVGGWCDC